GINVLRNDSLAALAIAVATGARFIRVNVQVGVYATDQGLIEGRADQTLRLRRRLGAAPPDTRADQEGAGSSSAVTFTAGRAEGAQRAVAIFADVHVKHARPLSCTDIAEAAQETAYRGRADALIVSGTATGKPTRLDD